MTNEEVLIQAITKAHYIPEDLRALPFECLAFQVLPTRVLWFLKLKGEYSRPLIEESHAGLLFDHEFAMAFWGERDEWSSTGCTCGGIDFHVAGPDAHKPECAKVSSQRGYSFHLKELAITPTNERLKYIEQFL